MKLLKKSFERDGGGSLRLVPEDEDDLWHLYNLVRPGDTVKTVTSRKVQVGNREDKTERVTLRVAVEVESIDYDGASELRCKGRCVSENPHIPLGAYHTVALEPRAELTLSKPCWDALDVARVEAAADGAAGADLAVVLIADGLAHVCLVGRHSTLLKAKVEVAMPKKKGAASQKGFADATARFLSRAYDAVRAHVDFAVVRCLLLAGPGFTKDQFRDYVLATAQQRGDTDVLRHKASIVAAHAATAYLQAIPELLASPGVAKMITDTQAAREVRALDAFFAMLDAEPSRAFYGPGHVLAAAEQGAIAKLLLADSLYRVHNVRERGRWVALVEDVEAAGGEVFIFSTRHVSGQRLMEASGIAAVLRFPMPELEERDPAELMHELHIA